MLYNVYWRDTNRKSHNGFVQARNRDDAYDITTGLLQKGCIVEAVYEANYNMITPQSLTVNFVNQTEYELF